MAQPLCIYWQTQTTTFIVLDFPMLPRRSTAFEICRRIRQACNTKNAVILMTQLKRVKK